MLTILARAKINLFLEVKSRRSDGYHEIDTVMQSLSLADELSIDLQSSKHGITLLCDATGIPSDERNIAHKAARAFLDKSGIDCGVKINIKKNIPSAAGMGGGSADGAAVLVGLNELCGNPFDVEELCAIAATFGADVPFCVLGGTRRLKGIGEKLESSHRFPDATLVIAKPPCGVSTPKAYACLDALHSSFDGHISFTPVSLLEAIEKNDISLIEDRIFNRFEEILPSLSPMSLELIDYMTRHSSGAHLSGSGAAVFALVYDKVEALSLQAKLIETYPDHFVTVCNTADSGIIIV